MQCSVQTARLLTETSVSARCSCSNVSVFSCGMTNDHYIPSAKRENLVTFAHDLKKRVIPLYRLKQRRLKTHFHILSRVVSFNGP